MAKGEMAAYDDYQRAKDEISDAVKTMKRAGSELQFLDDQIAEDIREVLDENGISVEDWII